MSGMQGGRRLRVLVVDDDGVDRRAIARFVAEAKLPYELTMASSLSHARERLLQGTFDVAVVDFDLGDGTGLQLIPALDGAPAILLTGAGSEQTAAAALALRASGYIVKDAALGYLHLLAPTIESAMSRRLAELEVRRYTEQLETEINSRQQAEESLRRSEEHLKLALAAANLGTWEWNIASNEILWSDGVEGIFGLQAGEFDGSYESYLALVWEDDRAALIAKIEAAVNGGDAYVVEHRIKWPDGRLRWLAARGRVLRDSDGRPVCMAGTVVDVTERIDADELLRLHQAELAHVARLSTMGELATGMAHEINQPLTAIRNYAGGCLMRLPPPSPDTDDLREAIGLIAAEAERAGEIIRRLRRYVSNRELRRSTICMNDLVREVMQLLLFEVHKRGMTIALDLVEPLPLVFGDSIQLEQVIINLALNGLEAMEGHSPSSKQLTVSSAVSAHAELDGAHAVQMMITDDGPGLEGVSIDRLFEPFFTTKPQGLGMGLAISRSIVEAHGGRLWARSNARGASFMIGLPLYES